MGLSYTYSHWMQATEYLNAGDAEPTKMISDLDVPHRLSVSGIFELPFGKGRRFLSDASGFLNALVGGWQIQGVYTYQSGFPIPFGLFNLATGVPSGDLFYNGGDVSISDPTTARWFNTDAFTSILTDSSTNATPVNHLRTLPYRFDDVRRDSINNVDLSLIKDVVLKGDVRLQLRAEFINAFNEAYFPNPVASATSIHVRADLGFEPGQLRPARPDRSEGRVLGRQEVSFSTKGTGRPATVAQSRFRACRAPA